MTDLAARASIAAANIPKPEPSSPRCPSAPKQQRAQSPARPRGVPVAAADHGFRRRHRPRRRQQQQRQPPSPMRWSLNTIACTRRPDLTPTHRPVLPPVLGYVGPGRRPQVARVRKAAQTLVRSSIRGLDQAAPVHQPVGPVRRHHGNVTQTAVGQWRLAANFDSELTPESVPRRHPWLEQRRIGALPADRAHLLRRGLPAAALQRLERPPDHRRHLVPEPWTVPRTASAPGPAWRTRTTARPTPNTSARPRPDQRRSPPCTNGARGATASTRSASVDRHRRGLQPGRTGNSACGSCAWNRSGPAAPDQHHLWRGLRPPQAMTATRRTAPLFYLTLNIPF